MMRTTTKRKETHKFWNRTHIVENGIFSWEHRHFYVRSGNLGRCDVGIIRACMEKDSFSYWFASPYKGVVIDVGAHIGGFTIPVGHTASEVHAYEANSANYKLLCRNIELNRLQNVIPYHLAAGDGSDQRIGVIGSETTSPNTFTTGKTEQVPGICLYCMLEGLEDVQLMKLDCEGGEYGLLMNEPPELIRRVRFFSAELHYHPHYKHDDLVTYIRDCGYRVRTKASRAASAIMMDAARDDTGFTF